MAEVARERLPGNLSERTRELDPGRTATDDDECEQGLAAGEIGLSFGVLESQQDATANLQRILEVLQSRREAAPLVVAKIGVRRAGGENQVVIAQLAVGQDDAAPGDVDALEFRQQDFDVGLPPENPPDR